MSARGDPVDEALELLRSYDCLELPPPFERLPGLCARPRRRLRLLPTLAVVLGLGAAAAAGGLETLRALWYRITVDGHEVSGFLEGSGERTAEFTTDDGCHVTVRVQREAGDGTTSTGIAVTRSGPGELQEDFEQEIETTQESSPREILSRAALAGSAQLHEWRDARGTRWSLHLASDTRSGGSRLLLHELDSADERPVFLLARTERALGDGGRAEVIEGPDGEVRVILDDGAGGVFELAVGEPSRRRRPTEYRSPDGRVQVRIDD